MIRSNTCIAVIRNKKGKLMFAGDRRISWGNAAQVSPISKVIKREDGILVGGTGNAYLCELLARMELPEQPSNMNPMMFVNGVIIPSINALLEDRNLIDPVHKGIIHDATSVIIILGIKSELFEVFVDRDMGIGAVQVNTPYTTGCGGDFAMGSLLTTEGSQVKDDMRLKYALRVAAQASPGCDANIDIVIGD